MGHSKSKISSTRVEWMWNATAGPSATELDEWRPYSDIESRIIEEAFAAGESHVMLDNYHIDLKQYLQISNKDSNKQRSVKRMLSDESNVRLRTNRFLPNPIAPDLPFGIQYGFISPFIKEVVKHLNLTKDQLPSKDKAVVATVLEKVALGIIEEGKISGKEREAQYIAEMIRAKKKKGVKEIWECCANLYTLESFLYTKLNDVMRFIGDPKHEEIWRSKVGTLGPYCLVLWDNPFNSRMVEPGTILYRGTELADNQISSFRDECSRSPKAWHTFQAFTSCSRNRSIAEQFGNVLLIMTARIAFTIDLTELSEYSYEEEELLFPGVSFTIDQLGSDKTKNKHLIYVSLQHRHTSEYEY